LAIDEIGVIPQQGKQVGIFVGIKYFSYVMAVSFQRFVDLI
jgi:hypothetical protein